MAMVQVFLKHGQDPDSTVWTTTGGSAPALHVSDSKLASILLRNGANVNSLDSTELTALDVALGAKRDLEEIGISVSRDDAYNLVLLLLRYGGRVTQAGILSLEEFHRALFQSIEYAPDTVDPRVLDPPRLEDSLAQARSAYEVTIDTIRD
ncbi:hypothetical protein Daus18300_006594 [Diaporthe australafricana]|uniref:Ankyrin repeat protein n=1 Tax=Diaporthe australafricana TaxID=127596 RepID=A0ABR3WTW6_9PEZI